MSTEPFAAKVQSAPAPTLDDPISLRMAGVRLILRRIEPSDLGALVEFFASQALSPPTAGGADPSTHLAPHLAGRLIDLDDERDFVVGVFHADGGALAAVAGYFLADDRRSAEVRMMVAREFRRRGLATVLVRVLATIARRRGLGCLHVHTRRDNDAMRAIFSRFNATCSRADPAGIVQITLPVAGFDDLRAPMTARTPARRWSIAAAVRRARVRLQGAILRLPPAFPLP